MKKFYIKSLGCKQNAIEGTIIRSELEKKGYISTSALQDADIYILNSCSVTSHSDSEVHYLLNLAKRKNPKIKTVLTGCCAQTYKLHPDFNYKDIDLILGNSEKINIEKYIDNLFKADKKIFVQNIFDKKEFENKFLLKSETTRLNVKIQDGCNNRCSYCIIPFARGNSRSNSIENIIKQIEIAHDNSIKEIVFTGINIGQWGLEFNKTLLDLLIEVEKTDILRYRLSSFYVNEISNNLINFLSKSDKFCPHFHLSLQSLCDRTLKRMGRKYSAIEAMNLIKKLQDNFLNPYLGCDIIVGFPDETAEDFKITYDNLEKSSLTSIHCFPYSRRFGTIAYSMENQIQNSIKTKRAQMVNDLSKKLHQNFLNKNKNSKAEILIEKKSPKTGLYSAVTRNYIKIKFSDSNNNLRHTIKTVDLSNYELY